MTTRYVSEASIVADMARALRRLPSLADGGLVTMTLAIAGFRRDEVRAFSNRAVQSELRRRLAFAGV